MPFVKDVHFFSSAHKVVACFISHTVCGETQALVSKLQNSPQVVKRKTAMNLDHKKTAWGILRFAHSKSCLENSSVVGAPNSFPYRLSGAVLCGGKSEANPMQDTDFCVG